MAKVLIVVVRRYNPGEFWPLLNALLSRGHEFDIVSTSLNIQDEVRHEPNTLTITLDDIKSFKGYQGLVLVSGNPKDTEALWYNEKVLSLVSQADKQGHILGAICAAVPAIRNVAKGKKVSAFPLKKALVMLHEAGALYQPVSLTTDTNLATAENEVMTLMWATNICDLLEGKEPTHVLHESPFKRKARERRPIPQLEYFKKVAERTGKHEV